MSCRKSADHCLSTTGGFDFVLCSGIITSLIAATLCFVTFEFNDLRLKHDITHLYSIVSFFIYRLLELCARVTVIALFAVRPTNTSHANTLRKCTSSGMPS